MEEAATLAPAPREADDRAAVAHAGPTEDG
jgi:hypothetical protein